MAEEFRLTTTAFPNGGHIPRKFTADGAGAQKDMSPPLEWYNVPEGTESLAIIMEDLGASDAEGPVIPFVHWVVVNIPPTLKGLPAGFNHKDIEGKEEYGDLQEGVNDFKMPHYLGPSPPKGNHRIEFRLYALDRKVKLGHKATAPKFRDEYSENVIAEALLVGYYSKEKAAGKGYISARDPMDGQSLYNNFQ